MDGFFFVERDIDSLRFTTSLSSGRLIENANTQRKDEKMVGKVRHSIHIKSCISSPIIPTLSLSFKEKRQSCLKDNSRVGIIVDYS